MHRLLITPPSIGWELSRLPIVRTVSVPDVLQLYTTPTLGTPSLSQDKYSVSTNLLLAPSCFLRTVHILCRSCNALLCTDDVCTCTLIIRLRVRGPGAGAVAYFVARPSFFRLISICFSPSFDFSCDMDCPSAFLLRVTIAPLRGCVCVCVCKLRTPDILYGLFAPGWALVR